MALQLTPTKGILIGIGFMAALLATLVLFDTDAQVLQLLQWLETQGLVALLWFVLIMALAFVLASLLGFIPFSLHNMYLGSIAADIATLGGRNSERTALQWGLYGAGFVASIVLVLYLNRLASRLLAQELGGDTSAAVTPAMGEGDT